MASITLTELTNGTIVNNQWKGSGVFDILIEAVNKNIEIQYNLGRLKGTDYANVYLQGMQASIQQASDFLLKQRELEVKLDIFAEEAKLARANTSLSIAKALAEIKKQYGFEATLNLDGTISIGADLQNGIIDKELELKIKQIEKTIEDTKVVSIQKVKLDKETALLGLDDVMKISMEAKDGTYVYNPSYII